MKHINAQQSNITVNLQGLNRRKTMNIENLLSDRNVLLINKVLAEALGLNASIVLRQLHYWLENNKELNITDNFIDSKWWSYRTYETYAQKDFTFWSISTIRDLFKELRDLGIVEVAQHFKWKANKTNWYTINYPLLQEYITIWITMGKPKFSHKRTGNQNLAFQAFINKWNTVLEAHMTCARSTDASVLEAPSNIRDYKEERREENLTANAVVPATQSAIPFEPLTVNQNVSTSTEHGDGTITSAIGNMRPGGVTVTEESKSQKAEKPKAKRKVTSATKRHENLASVEFTAACIEVANVDSKINFGVYRKLGFAVEDAGYTIQDLQNFKRWWYEVAKHKKSPDIWAIRQDIKEAKEYYDDSNSEPLTTSESVYGSYTKPNLNDLE